MAFHGVLGSNPTVALSRAPNSTNCLQPDTGDEARTQVHHPPVDSRHVGVGVEHHFLTARC
jgi:hypothetical protein